VRRCRAVRRLPRPRVPAGEAQRAGGILVAHNPELAARTARFVAALLLLGAFRVLQASASADLDAQPFLPADQEAQALPAADPEAQTLPAADPEFHTGPPADPESGLAPPEAAVNPTASALLSGLLRAGEPGRHRTELSIMDWGPREDYAVMPRVAAPGEPRPGFAFRLLGDERELIHESERWRSREFVLLPPPGLFEGKLLGRGEVAAVDHSAPTFLTGDQTYRLLSAGLVGESNGFGYGASYRSVGKKLEKLTRLPLPMRDQEGGELWLERKLRLGRVRVFLSEFADNVDRDPARSRTTRTQAGVTAAVTLPSWPTVSLSYLHGSSERSEPGGRAGARNGASEGWLNTLIGSLSYRAAFWNIAVSSTYSSNIEKMRPWRETITLSQEISGAYRPTDAITITASASRRQEEYEGSDVQTHTTWASVSLVWNRLFELFQLTASGSYLHTTTTDGSLDGTTMTVAANVARQLGKLLWGTGVMSMEFGYNGYRDGVYPEASYREVFGLLRFRIVSF
jgi:hypothetical protein